MKKIKKAMADYWGYDTFLPLQKEAMQCVGKGRDSVVILPTGGGKSLCYQVPAVTLPGLTVVVSPLISLMKDQVDALNQCGVSAAKIDSTMDFEDQKAVFAEIYNNRLKLLYLAPERLISSGFLDTLKKVEVSFIAIDEAHCVSMWGHDFRPEYRQLGQLKKLFPKAVIGAYTATATEQVRDDIAVQLKLDKPEVIIGSFDRPNLTYKVRPRNNIFKQVCTVLDEHENQSGVIYCIRRKDVDDMCKKLKKKGYNALPYHAGMTDDARKKNQDRFIKERVDIIVATVAFGMGIDKSNVRFVIHTGMPKSLEHYQQESGRAGRDGLEAQCWLFYSGGDFGIWKSFTRDMGEDARKVALGKIGAMYNYCTGAVCRHRHILQYFGQDLDKDNCSGCDICLDELDTIDDALVVAQKILSSVLRVEQRFGANYNAQVLTGSKDKRILENNHDALSTHGILSEYPKQTVSDWIEQLAGQGYIEKVGEYNVLAVSQKGWSILKDGHVPRLLKSASKPAKVSKTAKDSWQGVDKDLFDALRQWRKGVAAENNVPAFVVFGDASLRDMARKRPSDLEAFMHVKGVGKVKAMRYGQEIIEEIKAYCRENSLQMDIDA